MGPLYLFPPLFMYCVISSSDLISGNDAGISTMQPLIVVEGDIRANDYLRMILIE
jgi:hypothetical protein